MPKKFYEIDPWLKAEIMRKEKWSTTKMSTCQMVNLSKGQPMPFGQFMLC